MEKQFHACATCNNFLALKTEAGMTYKCIRLGFDTKPSYQFNCWDPKDHIKKLMKKQNGQGNKELTEDGVINMSNVKDISWLRENLLNENVRVVDCRFSLANPNEGLEAYVKDHIPGAVYFHLEHDLSSPVQKHGGRHPLPDIIELKEKLEAAGIDNNTTVIAYDNGEAAFAGRFWWLMNYIGHEHVFVLDGGYSAWKSKEYPVDNEVPTYEHTLLNLNVKQDILASIEEVKSIVQQSEVHTILIDSRDPQRYLGLFEPIDKRAGHIPYAINKPYAEGLVNGFYKSAEEQAERFADLDRNKPIIVYCGSGVTATPNYLALKEAGFNNVKLYLGSFSDWISYEENEVHSN